MGAGAYSGPVTWAEVKFDNFLPPWVQMAPAALQLVVAGSVIVMASLPLGWTVMVQLWLLPLVFRTALTMVLVPLMVNAWSRIRA